MRKSKILNLTLNKTNKSINNSNNKSIKHSYIIEDNIDYFSALNSPNNIKNKKYRPFKFKFLDDPNLKLPPELKKVFT